MLISYVQKKLLRSRIRLGPKSCPIRIKNARQRQNWKSDFSFKEKLEAHVKRVIPILWMTDPNVNAGKSSR